MILYQRQPLINVSRKMVTLGIATETLKSIPIVVGIQLPFNIQTDSVIFVPNLDSVTRDLLIGIWSQGIRWLGIQ